MANPLKIDRRRREYIDPLTRLLKSYKLREVAERRWRRTRPPVGLLPAGGHEREPVLRANGKPWW